MKQRNFLEQIILYDCICYWVRFAYRCLVAVACIKFIFWGGWWKTSHFYSACHGWSTGLCSLDMVIGT